MWFSHELFLYGLWGFSVIFCVCSPYTLHSLLWHQGRCSSHQCQDTCSICMEASATLGPQCSSGLPSVTTEQIFHFLQLLCKFHFIPAKFGRISTPSFQLCKDLLQTDSSFDLCFLTEIDNEDVTQSQEGWWDTGLPPNLSQLMEERKWSKIHVWLSRKPGEWGGLGGKWLPWRCLYNWGHLT